MRKTLPPLFMTLFITCVLWSAMLIPSLAQPAGWSGDDNLAFLLEANGVSAADSDASNPIPVDLNDDLNISLEIDVQNNLTIKTGAFTMQYMGVPIISQAFTDFLPQTLIPGASGELFDISVPLDSLLGTGDISLVSGTVVGTVTFTYVLVTIDGFDTEGPITTEIGDNVTITDNFVLHIGPMGAGALLSVSGMITAGFTVMSVFSLLLALDDFQQGIFAARKLRGAERASDVGIFPPAVVLRRKPKKGSEKISKDELKSRVSDAADTAWDGKRCPQCGKKWKKDAAKCSKCDIDAASAVRYFSEDIAEYAPKAMRVVKPRSKVPVSTFSKKLKLKRDKGGALAAALTDMGVFHTKSVKVPLKKVAFSGLTLSASYWSWMQLLSGATPSWVDLLLTATAGLVISVIVGYFMNWLARVPELGND